MTDKKKIQTKKGPKIVIEALDVVFSFSQEQTETLKAASEDDLRTFVAKVSCSSFSLLVLQAVTNLCDTDIDGQSLEVTIIIRTD